MTDLAQRTCMPCRGGIPPLDDDAIRPLLAQLNADWRVIERPTAKNAQTKILMREWRFPNFAQAMDAAVKVGDLAEQQQHHPDLHVAWGSVGLEIWTHKIDGLTESDFIFAAKCDALLPG